MLRARPVVAATAILVLSILSVSSSLVFSQQQDDALPTIALPPLHFGLASLKPHLSQETVNLHYNAHQAAYVTGLAAWFEANEAGEIAQLYATYKDKVRAAEVASVQNDAAAQLGDVSKRSLSSETSMISRSFVEFLARTLPAGTKPKNLAGQIYNHALYFQSLTDAPIRLHDYMTAYAKTSPLVAVIEAQWGSADGFLEAFKAKAVAHFGSGWVWLVREEGEKRKEEGASATGTSSSSLRIIDTHDAQVVFSASASGDAKAIEPVLVLDVWEHSYYVDYRNKRANYVDAWFNAVDWARVDKRFSSKSQSISVRAAEFDEREMAKRMLTKPVPANDVYPHFL